MSGPDPPLLLAEDDVWVQNAILIRQLYISEKKTLRQVKEVLENQHGFPSFPLSTYETKLRDKLRLRKKLKQADWPAVYRHVRERGEKDTGIYINGMRIPWKKAWKEIRRSGYRSSGSSQPSQLPEGVIVRTPSPTIRSPLLSSSSQLPMLSFHVPIEAQSERTSFHIQGSIPAIGSGHDNILDLSIAQHVGAINSPSPIAEVLNGFDVLYHRVFLETIPINTLRKGIHSIVGNAFRAPHNYGPASSQQLDVNALGDIMNVVLGLNCGTSSPMRQLGYGYSAPALNLDSYHFLERAIYLLSNKTTSWKDISMAPFDILFTRLQKIVLVQFLRSDHPTARATWEASVPIAWATDRMDVFSFLMNIGLERPDWILDHGHSYLSMAASAGSLDIVRGLLKIGVRADDDIGMIPGLGELPPAIMGAIKAKNMACVEALILGCDVNRAIHHRRYRGRMRKVMSNFGVFFSAMGNKGICITEVRPILGKYKRIYSILQLNLEKEVPSQALDMLLDHGADVDSKLVGNRTFKETTAIDKLHFENRVPLKFRLSFLDQAYYWDTKLYERLSPYSRGEGTHITRPGICISAKRGKEFLRAYLGSRSPQHPADRTRLLELILAEQFFMEDRSIDAQVVQGLVDFGVDIKLPTMATTSKTLCSQLVATAGRLGFFTDAALPLLQLLVSQGAAIDQTVMFTGVTETGLGILPQLLSYGADIKTHGGYALCCAAVLNNFEAVSWLLEAGADINATISTSWGTGTIIFLASVYSGLEAFHEPWVGAAKMEIEMLAYLIRHGAKLQLGPSDSGSYRFLKAFLKRHRWWFPADLKNLELLLDSVACPEDLATDQESLLSSWNPPGFGEPDLRLAAYELLLRRGCPIRRNCRLASYIFHGGRDEIVYKLLDAGADVNAPSRYSLPGCSKADYHEQYPIQAAAARGSRALVVQLLKKGANVNQPAAGRIGRTALQSVCEWEPLSIGDRVRKLDLVKFLIDQGADVNAPPAEVGGNTALQLAALDGDIATALVLLEHGAKINAPPALDVAAVGGRLDMVKLLLSMAAHSHDRGATGYAGAIRLAAAYGHSAVAELIREHIKTFGNCIIVDVGDGNLVDMPNDLSQSSADDDVSDDSDYGHVSDESEGYDSEDI